MPEPEPERKYMFDYDPQPIPEKDEEEKNIEVVGIKFRNGGKKSLIELDDLLHDNGLDWAEWQ